MLDELFRFSVLRAPDDAKHLEPIVIGARPAVDNDSSHEGVVRKAIVALEEADLGTTQVKSFVAQFGLLDDRDSPTKLAMVVAHGQVKARDAFRKVLDSRNQGGMEELRAWCRFIVAASLILERKETRLTLSVREWMKIRPLQIDTEALIPANMWKPENALARPAAIMDHYVVREKLIGYEMGQIEDIKNYLKGEEKSHSLRYLKVDEEEIVDEKTTEQLKSSETATQQRSTLSAASQTTANSTLGVDARVQTSGQYGPTKVDTNLGFQYSSSTSEAKQSAAEFTTEVMNKSVEETRQKELKRITRRRKTEIEEARLHSVNNVGGAGHIVGIYRWVDSVWEAKTYRVGWRLVLELLVAEPGRAIREAMSGPKKYSDLPPKPDPLPPWELSPNLTLYEELANHEDCAAVVAKYASKYGAEGITAPPDKTITIGTPFVSSEVKDNTTSIVQALAVKNLKIPKGYVSKVLFIAVTSMARLDIDPTRRVNINVVAPGKHPVKFDPNAASGTPQASNPMIFNGGLGAPDLITYVLKREHDSLGMETNVPVSIYTEDLRGFTGFVEAQCELSASAFEDWKLDACAKITAAYGTRLMEWEAAKAAKDYTDPPKQRRVDLQSLAKHVCIASLLDKWPNSNGRHHAADPEKNWPLRNGLAKTTSDLILFMEQAFEWHNIQYVAYPYYWAGAADWSGLTDFTNADPKVVEMISAGAVRFVIPVPLNMSDDVLFFLKTGIPFMGSGAPSPLDPNGRYLAIADEIRQLREKKGIEEEELTASFSYKLPTTLTILQADGTLPTIA